MKKNIRLCDKLEAWSKASKRALNLPFDKNGEKIPVVELFAGVGGFRVGLERASERFVTVWNNQWEPSTKKQDASDLYVKRFGADGHSNENICTVAVGDIPGCKLLVGGFPCQDYSVATTLKRSGGIQGKKGVLWWEIYRILNESEQKPVFLLLENVDRLLKSPATQRGRDFAIILASLADLGYAVEWRVINAADYGMPQRRRRTYIVAYNLFSPVGFACEKAEKEAWIFNDGIIAKAFCAEKTCDLVHFRISGDLAKVTKEFNSGAKKLQHGVFMESGFMVNREVWTATYKPLYDGPVVNLGDILLDESDVPEEFYISGAELGDEENPAAGTWRWHKGKKVLPRVDADGHEYNYSEGAMAFPDALDKPSRTIITGEGGSGASRFKHVVQTPSGRYRRLVPVELERLDMFPDNHTEGATASRRAFLMGNALVTGIVERIGTSIISRYDNPV